MTIETSRSGPAIRIAATLLAAALTSIVPALADQVVYFVNGKAIMVKSLERQGVLTFLEMEGGGRMGVPSEQIARVEEYEVSAPVIPAPPVAAQTAAPAQAPVVTAGAPPTVLTSQPSFASLGQVPAGPGVAGQPSARAPLTPVNAPGPAPGGPAGGALMGSGGPYRPAFLGAQGRRFGKGAGPMGGRNQRGTAQGGFRNRPAAPAVTDPAGTPAGREPADPEQDRDDQTQAPAENPDGGAPADQGDSGS